MPAYKVNYSKKSLFGELKDPAVKILGRSFPCITKWVNSAVTPKDKAICPPVKNFQ